MLLRTKLYENGEMKLNLLIKEQDLEYFNSLIKNYNYMAYKQIGETPLKVHAYTDKNERII